MFPSLSVRKIDRKVFSSEWNARVTIWCGVFKGPELIKRDIIIYSTYPPRSPLFSPAHCRVDDFEIIKKKKKPKRNRSPHEKHSLFTYLVHRVYTAYRSRLQSRNDAMWISLLDIGLRHKNVIISSLFLFRMYFEKPILNVLRFFFPFDNILGIILLV